MLDNNIMCIKWKDKREVALLSTFHDDSMIDKRRRTRATEGGIETISKPKAIDDYNTYMGGVDLSDQLLHEVLWVLS